MWAQRACAQVHDAKGTQPKHPRACVVFPSYKWKVDLCVWGHVHNAEQTCPLRQGKCVRATEPGGYDAPVHAVIGNAGQSLSARANLHPLYV